MLRVEIRKILHYQKGLVILLLCLLTYIVLCIMTGYDSSYVIDRGEETYRSYIERWQGPITEQTAREMEKEYYAVNRSNDGHKAAFMVVYNQYYYAKEDTTRRYIMDERGWNTILTHDGLNLLMLLCLLAVSVPVFCDEYQCGMNQILRTCRNGRYKLARIKLFTMIAMAIFIVALFQIVQLTITAISVGLAGSSFPLQSLSFFEHSPYSLTIGQTYLIVFFCRLFGAAWFALLLASFSILFRRTILTAFAGIAVSLLPYLIGSNFVKYVLPLPAGMLAGTGYVWGTLTEAGYDSEWNLIDIVTFPGITPAMLAFLFIAYWIIIVLLFHFSVTAYVGKRKTARHMIAIPSTMVLLLFSLTGCTSNNTNEISHDFLPYAERGENSAYFIELDMVDNTISATEKAGGNRIILTRDPLSECDSISSVFVDESACYYVTQSSVGKGFEIYRIDLSDFSTRLFFSSVSDNASTFWGLYRHELTADDVLAGAGNISSFVVDGNVIYYLQNGQLYKIHRLSGSETVLLTQTEDLRKLAYQNGAIIYEK